MHSAVARVIDMVVTEPLLGPNTGASSSSGPLGGTGGGAPPAPAATPSSGACGRQPPSLGPNLHFTRRFRALMALLRPYPALALSLLAIAEALVVAEGAPAVPPHRGPASHRLCCRRNAPEAPLFFPPCIALPTACLPAAVGKVAGSFYQIVVDNQPSKLVAAMLHAAALYAAATALYAASSWVTGGCYELRSVEC